MRRKVAWQPIVLILALMTGWFGCGRESGKSWTYDGELHRAIATADRIVVRSGGFDCCESVDGNLVLFELTSSADLQEVREHLQFESTQGGSDCLCCGHPGIDWYRGEYRLALTAVQHGRALRWRGFPSDAVLTDKSSKWLEDWLSRHVSCRCMREGDAARWSASLAEEAHRRLGPMVPCGFLEAIGRARAEFARRTEEAGMSQLASVKSLAEIKRQYVLATEGSKKGLHASLLRITGCLPMQWNYLYRPEQQEACEFLAETPREELDQILCAAARSDDPIAKRGAARLLFSDAAPLVRKNSKENVAAWITLLVEVAYADPFPENRSLVMQRLKEHVAAGSMDVLTQAVEDPDSKVREDARAVLALRSDPEAADLLHRATSGSTPPRKPKLPPKDFAEGIPGSTMSRIWGSR